MRWVIWGLAALFFSYEFVLRVSPSVMVVDLMEAFHVNAESLGTLSAFYLYIYAPMQLPVGILMDRYGAHKLLTLATISCGIGGILFGFAYSLGMAEVGRLFMGFGSAFAFVGMVYVSSHWFEPDKLSVLVGMGNSIGMLGAVFGEGPLTLAVETWGWRSAALFLGFVGLGLGLLTFLTVRNMPKGGHSHSKTVGKAIHGFRLVCKNPYIWINALVSLGFYSITVAFAALWGDPFLQSVYGFSNDAAGFGISMFFIGWIAGGPLIGHFSSLVQNRPLIIRYACVLTLLLFSLLLYYPFFNMWIVFFLLFFIGYFSAAQLLTFGLAIRMNPPHTKGSALALTNFFVMLGGSILQPLIGWILDFSQQSDAPLSYYSTHSYQAAFTVFPILLVFSIILSFFLPKHPNHKKLSSR